MKARHAKFYAVKEGRQKGIFLTWEECKEHTWRHQNAAFRAFPNREEAYAWLGDKPQAIDGSVCRIYTDGSHQRQSDYLGIGAWCLRDGTPYEYSAKVTRDLLDSYGVPKESECSNPTAEFIAFAQILRKLSNRKLSVPIMFVCDYVGVKNWMEGTWKANEPHIVAILNSCKATLGTIDGKITFEWVKGHSGNDGNNNADRLAGSHDEIDDFDDLVKLI